MPSLRKKDDARLPFWARPRRTNTSAVQAMIERIGRSSAPAWNKNGREARAIRAMTEVTTTATPPRSTFLAICSELHEKHPKMMEPRDERCRHDDFSIHRRDASCIARHTLLAGSPSIKRTALVPCKKRKREECRCELGNGAEELGEARSSPSSMPPRGSAVSIRQIFRDHRVLRRILVQALKSSPDDPSDEICRCFQQLALTEERGKAMTMEALKEPDVKTGSFPLDDLLESVVALTTFECSWPYALNAPPTTTTTTLLLDAYAKLARSLPDHPAHQQTLVRLFSLSPPLSSAAAMAATDWTEAILAVAEWLVRWDVDVLYRPSAFTGCLPIHTALRHFRRHSSDANGDTHLRILLRVIQWYQDRNSTGPSPFSSSVWTHRNRLGDLPAHVACRSGVPLFILKLVLEQTVEESSYIGSLHRARNCRGSNLADPVPRNRPNPWISSTDRGGRTLIDLLWLFHVEGVDCEASSRYQWRDQYNTPRHGSKSPHDVHDRLLRQAVDHWTSSVSWDDSNPSISVMETFLERASLVVWAAWTDFSGDPIPGLLLHFASAMAPSLPRPILDAILHRARSQAKNSTVDVLRRRDERGRTPLHYCFLSLASRPSEADVVRQRVSRRTAPALDRTVVAWTEWIEHLLQIDPGLARIADDDGRLPLHYSLVMLQASEIGVVDEAAATGRTRVDEAARAAVDRIIVHSLLRLHPESSQVIDHPTGLYPFLLAAITSSGDSVDQTYELLRLCPHVLGLLVRQRR